jgi:GH24 family phage-related lysozyme (muramidase)
MQISPKAFDLIVKFEGLDRPGVWPGGQSGVTIGYGYDLGYRTSQEFLRDWGDKLPRQVVTRLSNVIGKRGQDAREASLSLKDIGIPQAAAAEVLKANSIPWAISETKRVFPGVELLPQDAAGALVSIVFNRGGSTSGDSRREMRAIQKAVLSKDLNEIVKQILSMKRLWEGRGLDGLLRRREAEAALVKSCIVS